MTKTNKEMMHLSTSIQTVMDMVTMQTEPMRPYLTEMETTLDRRIKCRRIPWKDQKSTRRWAPSDGTMMTGRVNPNGTGDQFMVSLKPINDATQWNDTRVKEWNKSLS